MREYLYRCRECGTHWEFSHRWNEDAEAYCICGGVMARVPQLPRIVLKGSAYVNGERKISEFNVVNRDGSDVTYTSLRQAERGERERGLPSAVVKQNVEYLHKRGYVPGTWQHDFKQACSVGGASGAGSK